MPPLTPEETTRLESLIGNRVRAMAWHDKALALETQKGAKQTAFHTLSRHGYQTGWEAQLVRLMTGETPDQPFALDGVQAKIAAWHDRLGVEHQTPARGRNIRYAEADSTGAFIGPEVERAAIQYAYVRTAALREGAEAEMDVRGTRTWQKYKYIEIVVEPPQRVVGISFVRDKSKPKRERADFEQAFADYLNGGKVLRGPTVSLHDQMTYRHVLASGSEVPAKLREKLQTRFPNLADLLEYLHVTPVIMNKVRLVLKRVPENGYTWKLHTAYPVNTPDQIRPDAPGKWTGRIKDRTGALRMLSTVA
jgi:hypothetical protein